MGKKDKHRHYMVFAVDTRNGASEFISKLEPGKVYRLDEKGILTSFDPAKPFQEVGEEVTGIGDS